MLTMKDIIRDGHPTLREKAKDVEVPLSNEDRETLKAMRTFLINSQDEETANKYGLRSGVGLAAPQINISKKMIAVYLPDDGEGKSYDLMLVNPKIMSHSIQEAYLPTGEGCLSVDENIPGLVHRKYRITVKAKDIDGNDVKLRLKGYPAVVVQHEIDHINGIMFYDHIDSEHPLQPHEDAVEV
ncbi:MULTISPECIES: peptide deformylase [Staphylococcus]|uniref:Peptide deformylase n=1 Tax=Staphylococcus ureilyticus TaxID=94138 RepID=A0AB34AG01_STAUR|nr:MULTISPECIES: peptide deformylase [Staphylococcus]AVL78565.1 peptide deformylase [Staphylococcus cohnii]MBL0377549.1 peptide deformylase [Staphylococcus sp. S75]MBL0382680.1 peptide deformylase [Staphylococcus sp. S59]MBL0402156.1 peptide deformylase [Staphylococcus sp. S36]MCT1913823.1 peptide deformylase [Staphylococcus ureilyticus]